MKEINPYLKEVEKYLVDLPILDRNKIISELNSELLINREILKTKPLYTANDKRIEAGFENFEVESPRSSFGKAVLKGCTFMFICFLLFVGFLMWKFTPLFKIDEENQRVTILGGLIDIDGKAGRFILADEVHFTASNYTNDLTGSIAATSDKDQIYLYFESGKFDFKTSNSKEISFECKLSSPPTDQMIKQVDTNITLDFRELEGSNCTIKLPENAILIAQGSTAAISFDFPRFDIDLKLETGNVTLNPDENRTYFYDLSVESGQVMDFQNSDMQTAEHRIKIDLNTGRISR